MSCKPGLVVVLALLLAVGLSACNAIPMPIGGEVFIQRALELADDSAPSLEFEEVSVEQRSVELVTYEVIEGRMGNVFPGTESNRWFWLVTLRGRFVHNSGFGDPAQVSSQQTFVFDFETGEMRQRQVGGP